MRQKRSKTYRKLLSSYILHFGFRPPFQLLIDAPFAQSLSALHLTTPEVDSRLSDVLQTSQLTKGKTRQGAPEMKCMITQCCMVELYTMEKEGKLQKDAVNIAKAWERRRCNHREAIDGDACLKEVIGATNKHRYLLASDSKKLRNQIRGEVVGIPMVHTNSSRVIVLEPMSEITRLRVAEIEQGKVAGSTASLPSNVVSAKDSSSIAGPSTGAAITSEEASAAAYASSAKKRKVKEVNPLANKKPKKVLEAERAEKERRTREIAERTEANMKAREEEEKQQQLAAKQESIELERDQPSRVDIVEDDNDANEESGGPKKKRKRGGRGGGNKKNSTATSS